MPVEFQSVKEYIEYLKMFPFKGIGISGGEPFLDFDLLVQYIKEIRNIFGSRHHIWVYTNGDLVTEERLDILAQIGLNEIRFDLSANGYNLDPVELATNYINIITVEIPAIPEDVEIVKGLLKQLDNLGVKYINIHQLHATKHNRKQLGDRGYLFSENRAVAGVIDSELAAYSILKYAVDTNLRMSINYCSLRYQQMFSVSAFRRRFANLCQDEIESITKTGFLRRFSFVDSREIQLLPKNLEEAILAEPYRPIMVTYFYPEVQDVNNDIDVSSSILNFGSNKVIINKSKSAEFILDNKISAFLFHNLFIIGNSDGQSSFMMNLLSAEGPENNKSQEYIKKFYKNFEHLEYIPEYLPDYMSDLYIS